MVFIIMKNNFSKKCPNCGNIQTYKFKRSLSLSIKENWVCNDCSSVHKKKIYDEDIIKKIIELYSNKVSFSKIASLLKIRKQNVKNILIDKNVWIENRDKVKKEFTDDEIRLIIERYTNGESAEKIGKICGVSKRPIIIILKNKNLLREGKSDGKKIELTEIQKETIKKLYLNEYKNSYEIGDIMNLSKSFVDKYLGYCGYRRNRSLGNSIGLVRRFRNINYNEYLKIVDEFEKYELEVMKITRRQEINSLPNSGKRGNSGVKGAYHLDHKFSIVEGFNKKINPEIIGNIKNLEFIPWEENIKKRTKCSITINELIT